MNSKLLVDEDIRSGDQEVDDYITLLESVVIAYTSDNATRMVAEANRVIGILADDLSIIAEDGKISGTKLIKEEKNNMAMDRIIKLLQQTNVIISVSKSAVSIGKEIAYKLHATDEPPEEPLTKEEKISDDLSSIQEEKDKELLNNIEPAIEQIMREYKGRK